MSTLRLMSWNLLDAKAYDEHDKQWKRWSHRRNLITQAIINQNPDVLCAQELVPGYTPPIPGYTWVLSLTKKRLRDIDKGRKLPLVCGVAYKTDRWEVRGDVQMSSRTMRITLGLVGGSPSSNVTITNIHLPATKYESKENHTKHLTQGDILCGDFNMEPETPLLQEIQEQGLWEAAVTSGPTCDERQLDYIWVKKKRGIRTSRVRRSSTYLRPHHPSDHGWIMVDLDVNPLLDTEVLPAVLE